MDIKEHRRLYHGAGRVGPLMTISQLSDEDWRVLYQEFVSRLPTDPDLHELNSVYINLLADYGIACPHLAPRRSGKWMHCDQCDCPVILPEGSTA